MNEPEDLGGCASCGARRERIVPGGTATRLFHVAGCTRTGIPFGDHANTRAVIQESKDRDGQQIHARKQLDALRENRRDR